MIFHQIRYIFKYIYNNIFFPKILNLKYKNILQKNSALKDSKKGKRCFILGTGPSIKNIDLGLLHNEDTFAVNDFDKFPAFPSMRAKFYVIMDSIYFSDDGRSGIWGKNLEHKTETIGTATSLFLNVETKKIVEDKKLFNRNPKYYLSAHGLFSEKISCNIDIDKTIPYLKNVTLACLIIAVYMGYDEIYLLGCEHNYLSFRSGIGQLKIVDHCYEDDDVKNIDTRDVERDLKMSYESCIANTLQLFKNYRIFYQKVKKMKPSTKIFNATPNSFLDVFPKIDFKDIKFS